MLCRRVQNPQGLSKGKVTLPRRKIAVKAAAVQPDQRPDAPEVDRIPHGDIWELFRHTANLDEYTQSTDAVQRAVSIADRITQVVASGAATLGDRTTESAQPTVPRSDEPELEALYKHIKTPNPPDLVAALSSQLTEYEKHVFPSSAQPGNKFQGWGTLVSPDDLHVLVGHGRLKELEAYANAGYHMESSMHDSFRAADDGLSCSMYDTLRLHLVLNQLLHNDWNVLECLEWPSDDSLPEPAQGMLQSKDRRKLDALRHMPPETLMKVIIGSQLHFLADLSAQLDALGDVDDDSGLGDSFRESVGQIRPQFALQSPWVNLGRRIRQRTVTNADIQEFCTDHLLPTLVSASYMLAYDHRRLGNSLPLPTGEEYWEEFVARDGCWRLGNVVYQVLHLDMRLSVLRPRRGWAGYGYYNDRAPIKTEWFTAQ